MKNKVPPPVILLLAGALMWLIARSSFAYTIDVPFAVVIALLLAVAGVVVAVQAIRQFGRAATTVNPLQPDAATTLVDSGIFARTRNPMYLGLLLVLSGWAVWLQSVTALVVLAGFVLCINTLQIKPEEQALQKIFGAAYADYCSRVRRWI